MKMSELHQSQQTINSLQNEMVVQQQTQLTAHGYNFEKIQLIKNTVAKDATDLELQLFIEQCKRTGLDPITRQIYFIKNPKDGKVQIQTSIDGFRLVAERSGVYEGQTLPAWCGEDGVWKDVWLSKTPPSACRIGVWKKNFREPLFAIALFHEYAQKNYKGELSFMWNKMPALMIAKVAESLALRKAFPNDLSGLYTQEEMAQSTNEPTYEKRDWQPTKKNEPPTNEIAFDRNIEHGRPTGNTFDQNNSSTGNAVVHDFAPENTAPISSEFGIDDQYRIPFGKFKGKTLTECSTDDLIGYAQWLKSEAEKKGTPLKPVGIEFISKLEDHLRVVPFDN